MKRTLALLLLFAGPALGQPTPEPREAAFRTAALQQALTSSFMREVELLTRIMKLEEEVTKLKPSEHPKVP